MRYSLQYCQVLNNITVATKIKPKILQNLTHPLYYLLKLIEWQRILYRVNLVGLAQGLPQSHLQYTNDPLNNTIMTHSTVKCPKPAYHKEQKDFERALLSGMLRDYRKATCSTPTTHFNPKSSWLISCLKFVSLLPISCCLC